MNIVVVAAALVVFVVRCFKMNAVGLSCDRKPSSFFSLALSSELWLAEKKITKYFRLIKICENIEIETSLD